MVLINLVAGALLASLILYAVLAGADFGGGVWDLLATGPRKEKQRKLIESAIGPVWEGNHVWLILALVLLFTAFPKAYAALSTEMAAPLELMLVGIVLRGSAFVFRQYGGLENAKQNAFWGFVFALSSIITPFFLGFIVGKISGQPFPALTGIFALAQFTFLAAVYLTNETADRYLQNDFRAKAMAAGGIAVIIGAISLAVLKTQTSAFAVQMMTSTVSRGLTMCTALIAIGGFAALQRRYFALARGLAVSQIVSVLIGWAAAHYPNLIFPSLTLENCAAPQATLLGLVVVLTAGSILLFPSLFILFRIFKTS